jgi:hypothetical protein
MSSKKVKYDVTAPEWVDPINHRRYEREGREGFARAAERHDEVADGLHLMKMKTRDSAEAHTRRARDLILKHGGGTMPPKDYSQYVAEERAAQATYAACDDMEAREKSYRKIAKAQARVSNEPGPYQDESSPHSWVADIIASREPDYAAPSQSRTAGASDMSPQAVLRRLDQHGQDISQALKRENRYGREARAILRESVRCESVHDHEKRSKAAVESAREFTPPRREARAFGTDGGISATSPGEAASFVPPAILLKSWATYRTAYASFANQCKAEPMPDYGLNLYVPHVTGSMEVSSQTENASVAEKAPTAGLIKGAVVTKAGQVSVSYQFLDRAGPGIAGDRVLLEQLNMEIQTAIDQYAVSQSLIGAQEVIDSTSTFSFSEKEGVGGFLGELRKAKNAIATVAGTRLVPTHLFAPSKFVHYIEAFATSTGGPVWTPELDDNRLAIRSEGDAYGEGYSGYILSQLAVFADDNLGKLGTTANYNLVVARPDTVLVFRSAPVFYTFRETGGTTLDATLGARVYTATIPRWPEGVALLSGAFYGESKFA